MVPEAAQPQAAHSSPCLLQLVKDVRVVLAQSHERKGGTQSQPLRLLFQQPLEGGKTVRAEAGSALLERHPELGVNLAQEADHPRITRRQGSYSEFSGFRVRCQPLGCADDVVACTWHRKQIIKMAPKDHTEIGSGFMIVYEFDS